MGVRTLASFRRLRALQTGFPRGKMATFGPYAQCFASGVRRPIAIKLPLWAEQSRKAAPTVIAVGRAGAISKQSLETHKGQTRRCSRARVFGAALAY
jgi:hypothetical protein